MGPPPAEVRGGVTGRGAGRGPPAGSLHSCPGGGGWKVILKINIQNINIQMSILLSIESLFSRSVSLHLCPNKMGGSQTRLFR